MYFKYFHFLFIDVLDTVRVGVHPPRPRFPLLPPPEPSLLGVPFVAIIFNFYRIILTIRLTLSILNAALEAST